LASVCNACVNKGGLSARCPADGAGVISARLGVPAPTALLLGSTWDPHGEGTTAAPRREAPIEMVPAIAFFSFIKGKKYGIKERAKNFQERGWGFLRTLNKYY